MQSLARPRHDPHPKKNSCKTTLNNLQLSYCICLQSRVGRLQGPSRVALWQGRGVECIARPVCRPLLRRPILWRHVGRADTIPDEYHARAHPHVLCGGRRVSVRSRVARRVRRPGRHPLPQSALSRSQRCARNRGPSRRLLVGRLSRRLVSSRSCLHAGQGVQHVCRLVLHLCATTHRALLILFSARPQYAATYTEGDVEALLQAPRQGFESGVDLFLSSEWPRNFQSSLPYAAYRACARVCFTRTSHPRTTTVCVSSPGSRTPSS